MRAIALCLLMYFMRLSFAKIYTLPKCCEKDEELDYEMKACIPIDNTRSPNETLENISESIFRFHDVPLHLYGKIRLTYNKLSRFELDVVRTIEFQTEKDYIQRDFVSPVASEFIDEKRFCYDFSVNKNRSHIYFLSVNLKPLYKCCAKGERLNADASQCELTPGKIRDDIEEEILDPKKHGEQIWIPKIFSQRTIKVNYNLMRYGFKWKKVLRDGENLDWKIMKTQAGYHTLISIRDNTSLPNVTGMETDMFCFDEVADGPLAPRALLAAIYHVRKCCGKASQLDHLVSACVPRPGLPSKYDNVIVDDVNWQENSTEAFWLPESLRNESLLAKYWHKTTLSGASVIYDESIWTLEYSDSYPPAVFVNVTLLSGKSFTYNVGQFCFEYVDGFKTVLFVRGIPQNELVTKCCYPDEIISWDGHCVKHNGLTWTPGSSEVKNQLNPSTMADGNGNLPLKLTCEGFHSESPNSPRALRYLKGDVLDKERWRIVRYCNDLQMSTEGAKEVVGSCADTPTGVLHERIRPLGVLSVALLAGAAVMAVTQREMRRCVHGRALACHASCLCVANAIQVTWFFTTTGRYDRNCYLYSYFIYFFMMAANFWLTAITVNIAKGLRQSSDATAGGIGPKGGRVIWKQFGCMSLFAWGGAIILTILAVTFARNQEQLQKLGFITPSFFETRTCGYENYFFNNQEVSSRLSMLGGRLGSLFFYYVPMALLVTTNGVCVCFTVYTICTLPRDTDFLQRDRNLSHRGAPQKTWRNALLYAKLLLTAGIVELILEAVLWALGGPTESVNLRKSLIESSEQSYIFAIASTFIDLVRAGMVFWLCAGRRCRLAGMACRNWRKSLFAGVSGEHRTRHLQRQDTELTPQTEMSHL